MTSCTAMTREGLRSVRSLMIVSVVVSVASGGASVAKEPDPDRKPNVLFIAIDDLNDWVGCLGGNPQVKTPNLDCFAKQAVVMNRACCPSTVCCPSRSALLAGNPENDGRSFASLLARPDMTWNHPTLTTCNFKNHSITDGRYRYTWYGGRAGGAEELYDHQADPLEQTNLASSPEFEEICATNAARYRGLVLSLVLCFAGPLAADGVGIFSWAGWRPRQVSRDECPELRGVPLILHWHRLEPTPGEYRFEKLLREPLEAAHAQGLAVTAMIWVGPAAPDWLYKMGVPEVFTDRDVNPLGKKMTREDNRFPYYLSPIYKERFFKLIDAFGTYVAALPPELRTRIVLIQSCEGSTGDGQPYKGEPLDDEFAIPKDAWNAFRLDTWKRYQAKFPGLPILVNSDANGADEQKWLLDHMDVIALKHGMFSHGYHVSDNRRRLANFHALEAAARKHGKPTLTRGEMDAEMFVYGWSTRNIPQGLYWSGLMATHCGLDIWNIPHKALKDPANRPAFAFFNKFAGQSDPATAPAAFCALRDGLDASDFERFPAERFGGKPGRKRDKDRYLAIAKTYSKYGARMDDPDKALGGGMVNRKRSGSNDVGWGILPGNYGRFLTQIDPGSGDVGRWNIDDSIQGRFARGFEHKSGKTRMCFKLDPAFFPDPGSPQDVSISVTWLDKGRGAWSVGSPGADGGSRVEIVPNENTGNWKTRTVHLENVVFGRSDKRADLTLQHEDGEDTMFHMIAFERTP